VIRRFRAVVPSQGSRGPQPVWRAGTVLIKVLGLSRPERARVWRDGGVTVNGAPIAAHFVHCLPGDVLEAWYPEPSSSVVPEPETPLRVLYEDVWLLAVDKPAGQLSHPARGEQSGTTANAVAGYLAKQTADARSANGGRPEVRAADGGSDNDGSVDGGKADGGSPDGQGKDSSPQKAEAHEGQPVRLVNRLDRDTSGVLLFARDAATARALARQRAAGTLERTYLALVAGHPPARGEITLALGPDPTHRTRQLAYPPESREVAPTSGRAAPISPGQRVDLPAARAGPTTSAGRTTSIFPARTAYQVVQYGREATLVAVRLHTGRTHQVRVHFAAGGHRLIGDNLYSGPPSPQIQRQALHAWRTRLRHPATGAWLTIAAPLPPDFRAAVADALG
jgi:23S rRNA pseudouridine1911/1915/1917 synthase